MNTKPVLRRCIACRKLLNRQLLFKVTRDHKDGVVLEAGVGRSAYICRNSDCLEETCRRKRLQKALRCQVPASIVVELQERLNQCIDSHPEAR